LAPPPLCASADRPHREDRTFGLTCTTVDAFVGVDIELIFALIDAIDRANLDAAAVLRLEAGLDDDVGHGYSPKRPVYVPVNAGRSKV